MLPVNRALRAHGATGGWSYTWYRQMDEIEVSTNRTKHSDAEGFLFD